MIMSIEPTARERTVVFVVAPGVHLLDLAGPAQVFSTAQDLGAGYDLRYVGDTEQVASHQGPTLGVGRRWPALTPRDFVIVPGWRVGAGTMTKSLDSGTVQRIADTMRAAVVS